MTFNDHEGSTKSYAYTREHDVEVVQADFVPPAAEITTDYEPGSVRSVHAARRQLGAAAQGRRPTTTRPTAIAPTPTSASATSDGEVVTGLLYLSPDSSGPARAEQHRRDAARRRSRTSSSVPGSSELEKLQKRFR